jgi:hypothetical protein
LWCAWPARCRAMKFATRGDVCGDVRGDALAARSGVMDVFGAGVVTDLVRPAATRGGMNDLLATRANRARSAVVTVSVRFATTVFAVSDVVRAGGAR